MSPLETQVLGLPAWEFALIWILAACIPGYIALKRGYSFALGWGAGIVLGALIAAILLLLLGEDKDAIEARRLASGEKKCPHCAEFAKSEASVCPFCGRDFAPATARPE